MNHKLISQINQIRKNGNFHTIKKEIGEKKLKRINIHKPSWIDWINKIGILMNHSKKREVINEINKFMEEN